MNKYLVHHWRLTEIPTRCSLVGNTFNSLFTACCAVDELERALRVLARMGHAKIKPNIKTYELLFSLFGNVNPLYESGNWQSQEDVSKKNICNKDGHEEKWY